MSTPPPPPPDDFGTGEPRRSQGPDPGQAGSGGSGPVWSQPPSRPAGASAYGGVPDTDERTWGMLAHLSSFAGAIVALAFLGPLVVWLVKRDQSPFVADQAKEAMNFNLSLYLYLIVGSIVLGIVGVLTLGIGFVLLLVLLPLGGLAWLVLTIVAAVQANNGVRYRYPLTIRFVS